MDEIEKQRMQKYYSKIDEGKLRELLSEDRNDFQEGMYDLMIEEAKRRGLSEKPLDIPIETKGHDLMTLPHC